MKLVTIVGARPQFIKSAPMSHAINKDSSIDEIIVHTGQHYDKNMSDIFFEELNIPWPKYNLAVGSGTHGKQTAKMLEGIEEVLLNEQADALMVYGDTNSTIAGALAASKLHIPVIHVEAGLRSYNMLMPEEQNRVLTDHISSVLFCPTETAVVNLKKEGITTNVFNIGDVMYDSLLLNQKIVESKLDFNECIRSLEFFNELNGLQKTEEIVKDSYYLATIHRAENTDILAKLEIILDSFNELDMPVLFLVHPRTIGIIKNNFGQKKFGNIYFVKPVSYMNMLMLVSSAFKILTDSGGLQKEAYFLKKQCLTLRDQTEWVETLEGNWNALCKIDKKDIMNNAKNIYKDYSVLDRNYFGDGNASEKIIKIIKRILSK